MLDQIAFYLHSNSELIDMWQVLCGDEAILRKVFVQLLEVLTLSLPYQERNKGNRTIRYHTETPQSVMSVHVKC